MDVTAALNHADLAAARAVTRALVLTVSVVVLPRLLLVVFCLALRAFLKHGAAPAESRPSASHGETGPSTRTRPPSAGEINPTFHKLISDGLMTLENFQSLSSSQCFSTDPDPNALPRTCLLLRVELSPQMDARVLPRPLPAARPAGQRTRAGQRRRRQWWRQRRRLLARSRARPRAQCHDLHTQQACQCRAQGSTTVQSVSAERTEQMG